MSGLEIGFLVVLSGLIIAIAIIDIKTYRIPDSLNAALFVFGIVYVFNSAALSLGVQLISAASVFLFLLAVRIIYQKFRGVAGLGLGDVKMAGAAAVWIMPLNVPFLLLFASGTAVLFVLIHAVFWGRTPNNSMIVPFGPFIGGGLMIVWILQIEGLL